MEKERTKQKGWMNKLYNNDLHGLEVCLHLNIQKQHSRKYRIRKKKQATMAYMAFWKITSIHNGLNLQRIKCVQQSNILE